MMADLTKDEIKRLSAILDRFGDEPIDLASEKLTEEEAIFFCWATGLASRNEAGFTVAMARGRVKGDIDPEEEFDEEMDQVIYGEQ